MNAAGRRPIEALEDRRLFAAGDLDASFGLGGVAAVDVLGPNNPNGSSNMGIIDIAPSGNVVIGGTLDPDGFNGPAAPRVGLVVLDSKGALVKSFSGDGIATQLLNNPGGVVDLAVQGDGKIVVLAGAFSDTIKILTRFNANGTLDTAFGQKMLSNFSSPRAVALSPNGDIVVAGTSAGGITAQWYSSAGVDKGHASVSNGLPASSGNDVAVQADGKVVIAGQVLHSDFTGTDSVLVRMKPTASVDTGFGNNGILTLTGTGSDDYATDVVIDKQGRILAGVITAEASEHVIRALSNGTIDSTFADSSFPPATGPSIIGLAVAPGGQIYLSGVHGGLQEPYLARFNPNGGRDSSYGAPALVGLNLDVQADGKVVTAGGDSKILHVDRRLSSSSTAVANAVLGADGTLRITGTDYGNDDVQLLDSGPSQPYGVTVNGRAFNFNYAAVKRVDVNTLGGNDTVRNVGSSIGTVPRVIHGGTGNDTLYGGAAKDQLVGEDGNDKLYAGAGDDTLIDGPGTDLSDGGLGADTVDYSFRSGPVYVDLQGDADDGPAGEKDTVAASVEHIIGSKGNDTLVGDGRANYIDGRGGNDTIRGGGGNDTLVGGLGQDKLYGEDGNDFLDAKDGITDLVLDGGTGTDTAKKDNADPRISIEVLYTGP